jgi:Cyclin
MIPLLSRIHKYASCSTECFILALIYIDRLIQRSNFLLTELNVHRAVITAVLLAAKFFDDAYYNNAYYAKVGGVLVSEMNGLEVDFLFRINFSLHVTPDIFEKYRSELLSQTSTVQAMLLQQSQTLSLPSYSTQIQINPVNPQQPMCCPSPTDSAVNAMHHGKPPMPTHITPSPPAEAARDMHDAQLQMANAPHAFQFPAAVYFPVQRAHSMPDALPVPNATSYYTRPSMSIPSAVSSVASAPPPQRCGQQTSFSAPPPGGPALMGLHYPIQLTASEEQYIMMEQQIYPLQTNIIHHNHGNYTRHQTETPDPRLQPQQMLAGAGH